MEIIIPAAGLSTRFPNSIPKYMLRDAKYSMIEYAMKPYLGKYHITVGILEEHDNTYAAEQHIKNISMDIDIVKLAQRTKGPADTVYQIIKQRNIVGDILIKDCDSFFEHTVMPGNYICIANMSEQKSIQKVGAKSFVLANNQNIVQTVSEKTVISDSFCVGGYKFEDAIIFTEEYEKLSVIEEPFISHVIQQALLNQHIFETNKVSNYVDVGTIDEWQVFTENKYISNQIICS